MMIRIGVIDILILSQKKQQKFLVKFSLVFVVCVVRSV